jgi:hypothetical protein
MCNRVGGIGGRVDDPTASSANRSNRCGPEVGFTRGCRRRSARWRAHIKESVLMLKLGKLRKNDPGRPSSACPRAAQLSRRAWKRRAFMRLPQTFMLHQRRV